LSHSNDSHIVVPTPMHLTFLSRVKMAETSPHGEGMVKNGKLVGRKVSLNHDEHILDLARVESISL
jgi:hypothetical protein